MKNILGILAVVICIITLSCKGNLESESLENETPLSLASKSLLFIGSYTSGESSEGMYVYEFDELTGSLSEVERIDSIINPSFLTLSPNGKFLYACTESKLDTDGYISAFKIDSISGRLIFMNRKTTGGRNPVHVTLDQTGEILVCSNYTDAGISVHRCNEDGSLNDYSQLIEFTGNGIIEGRQDEAHVHSSYFSPDLRYLISPDLGSDRIWVHAITDHNKLLLDNGLSVRCNAGAGPRHFTFHPNGRFGYCIQELDGTVVSYSYEDGKLEEIDRDFSYSKEYDFYGAADIHISPDGLFLYASNRWENTLSIFSIDSEKGELTLLGHESTYGDHPRSFVIDPSGNYILIANQITGNVVVLKRDILTGLLSRTNNELKIRKASSLKMRRYFESN